MSQFGINRDDKSTVSLQREERKSKRRSQRIANDKERRARRNSFERGLGIFGLIALFVLIFAITKNLLGSGEFLTFRGLLELLQTAPAIDMSGVKLLFIVPTIDADWDAFNFLRNFINEYIIEPTNALNTMLVYVGEIGRNVAKFCSWLIQVLF